MEHSWILLIAMVGHILCVYADRLLLCTPGGQFSFSAMKDNSRMAKLFEAKSESDPLRSIVLGTVAMFLQFFGYLALGGAVHVICCYLVTGIKKELEAGADNLLMAVLHEQGGYVIPSMVIFLIFYLMHVAAMIYLVAKKKTFLPTWMWIMNPLTFKILINAFGRLGNSAVLNGILCSNMSFGAIIIFVAWWIVLLRLRGRNMEEQSE